MERNNFTVGKLNEYVNGLLTSNEVLKDLQVSGEISNYINHSSGHRYFSLKDKEGAIACVMFSFAGKTLKFEPKNGDKVIIRGYVGVYKKDGRYQLYAKAMEKEGKGSLYERYEALKEDLLKKGLFDKAHKKPLPLLKRKIGIVTSYQGAAVQDMLNIILRRYPNSNIAIYPAKVQGENAHLTIIQGIAYFNSVEDIDVIIIGRGGGSLEDLWAFNEEELAYAIFNSEKPIISAVGHETDFTIADFVADLRAPTPSGAAELCVLEKRDLVNSVEYQRTMLANILKQRLSSYSHKITSLTKIIKSFNTVNLIDQQRQTLDNLQLILKNSILAKIKENKAKSELLSEKLMTLNPKAVLKRGYSIVTGQGDAVIDSKEKLQSGNLVSLRFYDGSVDAIVK